MALPSKKTAPDSGFSKPSSNRNSDDLPLPDGPTMATYSPGAIRERDVVEHRRTALRVAEGHAAKARLAPDNSPGDLRSSDISAVADNQRLQPGEVRDGDQRFADARCPGPDRAHRSGRMRRKSRERRRRSSSNLLFGISGGGEDDQGGERGIGGLENAERVGGALRGDEIAASATANCLDHTRQRARGRIGDAQLADAGDQLQHEAADLALQVEIPVLVMEAQRAVRR